MACWWIYMRAMLTVSFALSLEAAAIWFYVQRVRPFMKRRLLASRGSDAAPREEKQ